MNKKLLLLIGLGFLLAGSVIAQELPILWEDHFEDDDLTAIKNVGWIYYPEADVAGQVVEQREGALFVEAGSYGGLVGVGLVETNGIPEIVLDEDGNITDSTIALSVTDQWGDPNQILTFQINFARFTTSNFFVGTRMPLDSSRGDVDPTESPAYALVLSPLTDAVICGKYAGPMAALAPDTWTYFHAGEAFDFDLEVYYWVKWYLNEGDIKAKLWEGELEDEPAEWLFEVVDPEPRVEGNFTMFAAMGAPPAPGGGDQYYLDDIVMRATSTTAVEHKNTNVLDHFNLSQNYPNPFNPTTSISFTLSKKDNAKLVVYNTMGQVIRTLIDYEMTAGSHQVIWDGLDESSNPLSSGVYLYQLISNGQTETKRMVLMK